MRISLCLLGAALTVSALGLNGCLQTCNQLCVENARYVDGCLETWDAMWSDFGYDGRNETDGTAYQGGPAEEYVERCRARYSGAMNLSGPEGARDVRVGCADDIQLVATSIGCNDYEPNDIELGPNQ